jgi:hypothetical protein
MSVSENMKLRKREKYTLESACPAKKGEELEEFLKIR